MCTFDLVRLRFFLFFAISFILATPFSAYAKPKALPSAVSKAVRGAKAIAKISSRLDKVAARHGMSAKALKRILERDESAWIDETDTVFYIEEVPELVDTPAEGDIPITDEPVDLADAFELQSKPGSKKTIYLDFTGADLTGSAWGAYFPNGSYVAAPFDLDGNTSSFNSTERSKIIDIWRRMSEDFAPFDVNVTTKDLGPDAIRRSSISDDVYGTSVLFLTKHSNFCSSCGGLAYVSVYSSTSDYYKPALVFYNLYGGNTKNLAEAGSHEAGHNLGLGHDGGSSTTYYSGHGSGETGWAPIMGVGYYKNLTQWSKGEYTGANNQQDDLVKIASHGLNARTDDHGNNRGSATVLTGSSPFTASGIIETRTDLDFFEFAAGTGDINIDATPVSKGANLDILLEVYNSSGQLVASANPSTLISAGVAFTGSSNETYSVKIDGVGKPTSYTDYASIGQYSIAITAPAVSGNSPPTAEASASTTSGVAPLAVTFSAAGSSDSDGSIVSFNWNFGDGQSVSGSNVQHTFTAAGTYNVQLTVTDDKGASDSDSLSISVSEPADTTPPNVSIAQPTPGSTFTSAGNILLEYTASDNVAIDRVEFYRDGVLRGTKQGAPYTINWNITELDNGTHTWFARAFDTSENSKQSSTSSYIVNIPVLDTTAPNVSITNPTTATTFSSAQTVSIIANASDNVAVAKVEFFKDGLLQSVDSSSPYSHSWSITDSNNGSHTWTARATDTAGNIKTSAAINLNVNIEVADNQNPNVSITSPNTGASITSATTQNISASASDNIAVARVEFYKDGQLQGSDTEAPFSFNWNVTTVNNGQHTWIAKAIDTSDNSANSEAVLINVDIQAGDSIPPVVSLSSPQDGQRFQQEQTVTVTATANDNEGIASVEFYLNDVLVASDSTAPYSYNWHVTGREHGSHQWMAVATDLSGNSANSNITSVKVHIPRGRKDRDKDGIPDEQELIDGTDPDDPGSMKEHLGQEVCTEWNGFFDGMVNIMEHRNLTGAPLTVNSVLYNLEGEAFEPVSFTIEAGAQYDLIVSAMPGFEANSIGQVCSFHQADTNALDGQIVYYRKLDDAGFDFAIALPFTSPRLGKQFVPINTFQPSLAPNERTNFVANWVQLVNSAEVSVEVALKLYSSDGTQQDTQMYTIAAKGRVDYPAHLIGKDKVGLVEVEPLSTNSKLSVRALRYYYDNKGTEEHFVASFQSTGKMGTGRVLHTFVDTRSMSSVLEILNTSDESVTAEVLITNKDGTTSFSEQIIVPAKGAYHQIVDDHLSADLGIASVESGTSGSLIVTAMQYPRREDGSIKTVYGVPGREALSSELSGSYNLFLEQDTILQVGNSSSEPLEVTVYITRYDGEEVTDGGYTLSVAAQGAQELNMLEFDRKDVYGTIHLSSSSPEIFASSFRKRTDEYVLSGNLR